MPYGKGRKARNETTGHDLVEQHAAIVAAHEATLASLRDSALDRRSVVNNRLAALEAEDAALTNLVASL